MDEQQQKTLNVPKGTEQNVNPEAIEFRSITEFRESGLLLFVNQFLNIFGWAICVLFDEETGEPMAMYPAYCKFRGFDSVTITKAYKNITKHIAKRLPALLNDVER